MMHMFYWLGTELGTFMFQGYKVTTTWGLVATCLGLASLAIIFEGMKLVQVKLKQSSLASIPSEQSVTSEDSSLLARLTSRPFARTASTHCGSWSKWFLEILHWSMHTTLGYLLMLAVMSYNGYFSIALAIGGGVGYWIFGLRLQQLNMLQFNEKRKNRPCDPECADTIVNPERRQSTVSVIEEDLATAGTSAEVHS